MLINLNIHIYLYIYVLEGSDKYSELKFIVIRGFLEAYFKIKNTKIYSFFLYGLKFIADNIGGEVKFHY